MNTMNLTFRVKELGSFLLIWGFVGFPITLLAYFDTKWSFSNTVDTNPSRYQHRISLLEHQGMMML